MSINTQCCKQNRKKETQQKHNGHAHKPRRMFILKQEESVAIAYLLLINPLFVFCQNMCVKWDPLHPALLPHTHTHFHS